MADVITAGVESGEFAAGIDVERTANLAVALLDGAGVRALLGDPEMDVEAARALVATTLAEPLGVEPQALLSPPAG
jgi:hypothetical protein